MSALGHKQSFSILSLDRLLSANSGQYDELPTAFEYSGLSCKDLKGSWNPADLHAVTRIDELRVNQNSCAFVLR